MNLSQCCDAKYQVAAVLLQNVSTIEIHFIFPPSEKAYRQKYIQINHFHLNLTKSFEGKTKHIELTFKQKSTGLRIKTVVCKILFIWKSQYIQHCTRCYCTMKECMLCPVVRYNTYVSQYRAFKTMPYFNFASLTVKNKCI